MRFLQWKLVREVAAQQFSAQSLEIFVTYDSLVVN